MDWRSAFALRGSGGTGWRVKQVEILDFGLAASPLWRSTLDSGLSTIGDFGFWILGPLGLRLVAYASESDLPLPCKRKLGADTTALTAHGPPDFLKILGGAAANLDFVRLAHDAVPIL